MNRGLITRKRLIQWDSFPQVLFPTGHLRSLEVNIGHWRFSELWWPRMTSNDIDETEKSKTSFICRRTGFYWITSDFGTHWRIFPRFTQGIFSKTLLQIIIRYDLYNMTQIMWVNDNESETLGDVFIERSKVISELLNGSSSNESHLWNNQCWNATTPEPFN